MNDQPQEWPGGGTVDTAHLVFGGDTVIVWPVPQPIRDMIDAMKRQR